MTRRKKPNPEVGEEFTTNQGYTVSVLPYETTKEIQVIFKETQNIVTTTLAGLRNGHVRNPFHRGIFGIGFNTGDHYHTKPFRGSVKPTKEYRCWVDMLRRCYDPKFNGFRVYGGAGVTVDSQWHNFQEFAEWCQWQRGFHNTGWSLDKDWLSRDSKIYSPETCCFVPKQINNLVTTVCKDQVAIGVHKTKGQYSYFKLHIGGHGIQEKFVKTVASLEEGKILYGKLKKDIVYKIAIKYKEEIEPRLFEAMLLWEAKLEL